jgi:chorismate mutase
MPQKEKKTIKTTPKFLLVFSAESGLETKCNVLKDRFEILISPLDKSVLKKIKISRIQSDTENLMNIETWMPYIHSKLSDADKKHLIEMPDFIEPSEVFFILQMAFNLEADGLVVHETHTNAVISYLSENKELFVKQSADPLFQSNTDIFRKQIDEVDNEIIQLLKRRNDLVTYLASLKNQYHLPMLQSERWNRLIEQRIKKAAQLDLEEGQVREMFNLLHKFALAIHMNRYFEK